jgi:cytosine/adenosine deaminase-related metal-dependent hydrolase
MSVTVLQNCAVAPVVGAEHVDGHVVVRDGRIAKVGGGHAGRFSGEQVTMLDATGCLVTPGLVNTHHHLYQWATKGLAQEKNLFGWLTELYPVWAGIDAPLVEATTAAGLAWLALSGCTTSMDHHYVHPRDSGDMFAAQVAAAGRIGLRFHPTRGSMDLGESKGGLPPDSIVEDTDEALAATERAIDDWHDPAPGSMLRVAVAPCSPFSVTPRLMTEAADLARRKGVRLHTHLAETVEEEEFCRGTHDCTPVEYAERLGWLGNDVWLAHGVHLDTDAVGRLGATGTGIAHCPSSNARLGAGIAPVRDLLDAGVPVGLGVDGPASQEAGRMGAELRQALLAARLRGGGLPGPPGEASRAGLAGGALTAREVLSMATLGGARCLGRESEIGSIEVGKLADLAVWRLDGIGHVGIDDPVAALVFGAQPPLELLLVGGVPVVRRDELQTGDVDALARGLRRAHRQLMKRLRP